MQRLAMQGIAVLFATATLLLVTLWGVSSNDAQARTSGATSQQVVKEAKSWLGTPYYLGGPAEATRSGIDCSGLTMG